MSLIVFFIFRISLTFPGKAEFIWALDHNKLVLSFYFDEFSWLFFVLVTLIRRAIIIWRIFYISSNYKLRFFFVSLFWFISSMLILVTSNRLVSLFLGWEGLGVSSFLLIVFYQNWIRIKGGLLTLLTNRLGDAMLLLLFSFWFYSMIEISGGMSLGEIFILSLVAFTKSAQWPFVNWLPAAIAAPTPVRALVHRSTLVTAGLWLLIRFGIFSGTSLLRWGILGTATLTLARSSALVETDAKKVVALSTLSQLGLMFFSISLGNITICYFHILMHALAKANLFIIIGNALHRRFSQQDTRSLNSASIQLLVFTGLVIRLASLIGLVFTRGFFSKEIILFNHISTFNRILSWGFILLISTLTSAYCINLFTLTSRYNKTAVITSPLLSIYIITPILILRTLRVLTGFFIRINFYAVRLIVSKIISLYWIAIVAGFFLLFLLKIVKPCFLLEGTFNQLIIIDFVVGYRFFLLKVTSSILEASFSESLFLLINNNIINNTQLIIRRIILFIISVLLIILLLLY